MNFRGSIVILLLFTFQTARSQIELGLNAEINAPLLFVKNVGDYNHSLAAFNSRFTLNYVPPEATFFPSLTIGYSSILVPMAFAGNQAISVRFATTSCFLSIGHRKTLGKGSLDFSLGIGGSYLMQRGIDLSGDSTGVQVLSTGDINLWIPSVNAGAEYTFAISQQVPLYGGVGVHVQYAWFFDKGRQYTFNVNDPASGVYNLQGQLYGHMINPGGFVSVYYRFSGKQRY